VVLRLGQERLTLALQARLPLSHTLSLEGQVLPGESAALVRRADGYWLEPTPGRQQVSLNGRPVTTPIQLSPGDTVSVGPVELEFVLKG
jgi:hypothetical protein